jgi:serine/threonine-protein kinase
VIADRNDQWAHFADALTRVIEYTELGALDRAARVADEFLRRREAWTPDPGVDYFAVAADGVPIMLKALVRAGKLSPDELERRRGAWIDGWRARVTPQVAHYLWVYGYAQVVDTPAEARAALDALPAYEPLPPFRPAFMADAHIGRTYALAGRLDDALPLLERSTKRCDPMEEPFVWVQSSLWLGEALETAGRTADACDAYRHVTTRWATIGPRSVTLREARKRMNSLHCAK